MPERVAVVEVGVVALPLTGERDVQRVVDVVVPLRVETESAGARRVTVARVVAVVLGHEDERSAELVGEDVDRAASSSTKVSARSSQAWMASSRSPSRWKSRSQDRAFSTRNARRTSSEPAPSRFTAWPHGVTGRR